MLYAYEAGGHPLVAGHPVPYVYGLHLVQLIEQLVRRVVVAGLWCMVSHALQATAQGNGTQAAGPSDFVRSWRLLSVVESGGTTYLGITARSIAQASLKDRFSAAGNVIGSGWRTRYYSAYL